MKTLVIYENPVAHQDIIDWAKKLNLKEITESKTKIEWELCREHKDGIEDIKIIPSSNLEFLEGTSCTKLVLYGRFSKEDLDNIRNKISGNW